MPHIYCSGRIYPTVCAMNCTATWCDESHRYNIIEQNFEIPYNKIKKPESEENISLPLWLRGVITPCYCLVRLSLLGGDVPPLSYSCLPVKTKQELNFSIILFSLSIKIIPSKCRFVKGGLQWVEFICLPYLHLNS